MKQKNRYNDASLQKKRLSLFCISLMLTTSLQSDTVSAVFENDLFAGTDQHYTNGIRLGWLSDPLTYSEENDASNIYTHFMYETLNTIPLLSLDPQKNHNAGFSLHQMMFTPQDITATEANYNDIPYAGHLMFSFFLFEHDENSYDEYKLQLGVVGPASGAAKVQTLFHNLTGSTPPQGWDTQLGNQFTLGIVYDHGSRLWQKSFAYSLSSDLIGSYGAQLGNFYTGAALRGVWRIGSNYPKNFNAYYTGTIGDNALLALQQSNNGFGWSVNLGLAIDGVGYFHVTDSDSDYMIDREPFLGDTIISIGLYYKNVELSVTKQIRFSLSKDPEQTLSYGAASLLWKY